MSSRKSTTSLVATISLLGHTRIRVSIVSTSALWSAELSPLRTSRRISLTSFSVAKLRPLMVAIDTSSIVLISLASVCVMLITVGAQSILLWVLAVL